MKVGIIGCGRMGHKRARTLIDSGDVLYACDDIDSRTSQGFARQYGCLLGTTALTECEVIVVSTPHVALVPFAVRWSALGKWIFLEKPGGIDLRRIEQFALGLYGAHPAQTRVGYTLRFHPAAQRLQRELAGGEHGPLLWVRGHYGHGGREGYESEWRCERAQSGGGELIDQGSHLIDLARWLINSNLERDRTTKTIEFDKVAAACETCVWDTDVEDNAFITLSTPMKQIAMLHASWTEWCPSFSLEVCTDKTLFVWRGLGGVYGDETLTVYTDRGRGDRITYTYANPETCWRDEWIGFRNACLGSTLGVNATLFDAQQVMSVIQRIYDQQPRAVIQGQVTGDIPEA